MNNLYPNFGVVKHDKKTHFFEGRLVQTHYQLLNTLQMSKDEVNEFLSEALDFAQLLRNNPEVVRYYIKYPDIDELDPLSQPMNSKNDVVYNLMSVNDNFTKTKYYKDFLIDLLRSYYKNLKNGHVYVNGNYSTLLGNPIEMLQQSIGKFDGKSQIGIGNIHSIRFDYNKTLLATGISNNQAQELMKTYSDMGKQLKVTGVDVATSATEWMKQGKTIEESNKLAQDSIVLSKIGDLSSDDATRTITAAMKSYDLNESQVMDFVDQISAIDMASATDVGGLADAFNEVAANANQAGISTKQLLSYAAVIGETTQEGMSSVGTSLNAIFSRMGNIKLARLKDYQNGGEDLSNVETVLRGVGISLRDTDGEFRNFGDVLDETAGRWSEFGTVQQRAVAQAFSGTNHMNDFMVLMQQYSKAQEYMQVADDASGKSMKKYGAYTDSLEGKLEGFKSTFESLSNTVLDSKLIKGFVDGGTSILSIFDKLTNSLGVMNTAAIGLGLFQGKNNSGKSTWDSPHAFFKMTYAA